MTQTHAAVTKTRRIAGHTIALQVGVRYMASRPFAARGRTEYPVTIASMLDVPSVVVSGLTYDEANRLLMAFNNGPMSFDGRVW